MAKIYILLISTLANHLLLLDLFKVNLYKMPVILKLFVKPKKYFSIIKHSLLTMLSY